jgi:hypothetical protein
MTDTQEFCVARITRDKEGTDFGDAFGDDLPKFLTVTSFELSGCGLGVAPVLGVDFTGSSAAAFVAVGTVAAGTVVAGTEAVVVAGFGGWEAWAESGAPDAASAGAAAAGLSGGAAATRVRWE